MQRDIAPVRVPTALATLQSHRHTQDAAKTTRGGALQVCFTRHLRRHAQPMPRQTTQWAFLSDRKFGPHLLSMLELFEANFEGPRHSDAACDENLDPTGSDLERYDSSRCQHDP